MTAGSAASKGMSMSFAFPSEGFGSQESGPEPDPAWVRSVEERVIDRVDAWLQVELDERVVEIVEEKLREETERRAWRRGAGVF